MTTSRCSADEMRGTARRMAASIANRGPDDEGVWLDQEEGLAIGFRRLAILDLSQLGAQPMVSNDGRLVIAFNGEIYNFSSIAAELEREGVSFRSHCDTEVLLEAFSRWGVARTLPQLDGMFAIALWDRHDRTIHLIRDRAGEKPLYYGWCGDILFFGSQLKAFREHPQFRPPIDGDAARLYAFHGCVPAPFSIYRGIRKVMPGSSVLIQPSSRKSEESTWWSLADLVEKTARDPFEGTFDEAVGELERTLRASVRRRMIADVPLGALLSGGIDSSAVVALMQEESSIPARTFTIGFAEASHDEAAAAREVAARLGTAHTELIVTAADAASVIPQLPSMYDEPFADSSALPTFLVSRLARSLVTVALSGDGGDELFGGYNRHIWAVRQGRFAKNPALLRRVAAAAAYSMAQPRRESLLRLVIAALPTAVRPRNPSEKLAKLAEVLSVSSGEEAYAALIRQWKAPGQPASTAWPLRAAAGRSSLAERMMLSDFTGYLADDILVKLDRATMAVSLEGRVPMLDPAVIELAWRLPLSMKIGGGKGKKVLRALLGRKLPPALFERPKMGFALPLGDWLRGPLKEWAASVLSASDGEWFDRAEVRRKWSDHLAGRVNGAADLWTVLMFEQWKVSVRS